MDSACKSYLIVDVTHLVLASDKLVLQKYDMMGILGDKLGRSLALLLKLF